MSTWNVAAGAAQRTHKAAPTTIALAATAQELLLAEEDFTGSDLPSGPGGVAGTGIREYWIHELVDPWRERAA